MRVKRLKLVLSQTKSKLVKSSENLLQGQTKVEKLGIWTWLIQYKKIDSDRVKEVTKESYAFFKIILEMDQILIKYNYIFIYMHSG